MSWDSKREFSLIIGLYCAAHLPLLVTTGIFLDSWTIIHGDAPLTVAYLWETGRPLMGYFLNTVLSGGGQVFPRLVTFSAYLAAGLCFWGVLWSIRAIPAPERWLLVAVFMVYPVDTGRVAMIRSYSASCYAAFFCGFWLLSYYMDRRHIALRLLALIAFWWSFWINSFLVLYGLPLLYIIYRSRQSMGTIGGAAKTAVRYLDFICLPLLFWGLQKTVFAPHGLYANYNVNRFDSFSKMLGYLAEIVYTLDGSLLQVLQYVFTPPGMWYPVFIVLIAAVLVFLLRGRLAELDYQHRADLLLFCGGWFFLAAALFPYYYVGKLPTETDWASRFSQLTPLGVAFILFYGLKLVGRICRLPARRTGVLILILVAALVGANTKSYFEYWNDWYKARSIIREVRQQDCFRDSRSYLFRDNARDHNAKYRYLRWYEMTGLLKLAFNEETRCAYYLDFYEDQQFKRLLAVVNGEKNDPPIANYQRLYVVRDWDQQAPDHLFYIDAVREPLQPTELIRLKFAELLSSDRFDQALPQYMRVSCGPIPADMTFPVEKDPSMVEPKQARYSWPVAWLLRKLGRV